jgi:hypothetical protein
MERVSKPASLHRVVATEKILPLEVLDVVTASPDAARSRLIQMRLRHGLLRFPLGEPANSNPRW